MIPKMLTAQSK